MANRYSLQSHGRGQWHPSPSPDKEADRLTTLAESTRMRLGHQQPQIRSDPPDRDDGRCVNCRGERPEIAVRNHDPFCSTVCARGWHDQTADSP
jgi:hypothetical protein